MLFLFLILVSVKKNYKVTNLKVHSKGRYYIFKESLFKNYNERLVWTTKLVSCIHRFHVTSQCFIHAIFVSESQLCGDHRPVSLWSQQPQLPEEDQRNTPRRFSSLQYAWSGIWYAVINCWLQAEAQRLVEYCMFQNRNPVLVFSYHCISDGNRLFS